MGSVGLTRRINGGILTLVALFAFLGTFSTETPVADAGDSLDTDPNVTEQCLSASQYGFKSFGSYVPGLNSRRSTMDIVVHGRTRLMPLACQGVIRRTSFIQAQTMVNRRWVRLYPSKGTGHTWMDLFVSTQFGREEKIGGRVTVYRDPLGGPSIACIPGRRNVKLRWSIRHVTKDSNGVTLAIKTAKVPIKVYRPC